METDERFRWLDTILGLLEGVIDTGITEPEALVAKMPVMLESVGPDAACLIAGVHPNTIAAMLNPKNRSGIH